VTARRVMACAGWAGVIAVALRGVTGCRQVLASLAWLAHGQPSGSSPHAGGDDRHLVLIVPLLREQRLIASTVARMTRLAAGWSHASVVLVTTERELTERELARERLPGLALALSRGQPAGRFRGVLPQDRLDKLTSYAGQPTAICLAAAQAEFSALESTPDLARTLAAHGGGQVPVRHYHLPDPGGTMAGQVNYAAAGELARFNAAGIDPARVWLAIYNADSDPGPATLPTLASLLDVRPDAQIVQQPAVFTRNLGAGLFADGAAMLQSRWTLAREIPRLRRQAAQARTTSARALRIPRLAHCVGHGLFIRADTFSRLGGLPTTTMNEDLALGYLACAAGIPIDPLPVLERGDSPATVAAVIRQARQWFWSYPQYPAAGRLAASAGFGTRRVRVMLTAQGLARGALWLGQSPAVALALTLPMTSRRRKTATVAAAGALGAYYGVPFAALARHLRRAGANVRCGPRELLGGLVACVASSTGPWWCLGQVVRARLTGTRYAHDKTER
jgi:hypothetical protein